MQVDNLLLEGVVGSTAYGLSHEGSDIDKKGIFAHNTVKFHGLSKPKEVYDSNDPDVVWYEAAKWCNLALKCNPNILELVYLSGEMYTVRTDLGNTLIEIRKSFLSQDAVRNAYINYAKSQLRRIEQRSASTENYKKLTSKNARHLVRLMMQGYDLYAFGNLEVRLSDSDVVKVRSIGEEAALGNIEPLKNSFKKYADKFSTATPAIPLRPNETLVERWLQYVRHRLL